jgi:hypothetical protein
VLAQAREQDRQGAQAPVHELRGQRPIATLELRMSRQLGVQRGGGKGAVPKHADEGLGGHGPRRDRFQLTISLS